MRLLVSMRMAMSAILNTAVTRNTEKMMQRMVIRFWRQRTLAEMGTRLR